MVAYVLYNIGQMSVGALPDLQIPFDSPTFVPLTLQTSSGIHSHVPLQKFEKPVIFENI